MRPSTHLVTGAARGIGLALVRALAGSGHGVVAVVRDRAAAGELEGLASHHPAIAIEAADVTDEAQVAALAQRLAGRPLDVVINNAGVLNSYGGLDDPGHDAAAWARVMAVNVTGPFLVSRALLLNLRRAPAGKLVFISSSMASSARATGGSYPYRASKAAVTNLARNLAVDLRQHRIAVAIIDPGWVRTEMGGAGAPLDVETSARGILARIEALDLAHTGLFVDHAGAPAAF